MKKVTSIVFAGLLLAVLFASCKASGHTSQSWHPKSGKRPQAGHNRK